ncbi:MAG TPA: ribonuclease HI, partial [Verrucomicrobiae bacterium]|nr:ribonuclease HI [Verrucomicrobiae bacterium]
MKKVVIHSDGACHGNPGPGGWAATLVFGKYRSEVSGGDPATTNNRMELQGAIAGLAALTEPCEVEFYTDSKYVQNGVSQWVAKWKLNGWKTLARQPVKNEDLWRQLDSLAALHKIHWKWLKGHAGHSDNERCDQLATAAIDQIKKTHTREQLRAALARFVQEDQPAREGG